MFRDIRNAYNLFRPNDNALDLYFFYKYNYSFHLGYAMKTEIRYTGRHRIMPTELSKLTLEFFKVPLVTLAAPP